MSVQGESLVLVKTEPGKLCFDQVSKGSLTLRSTYVAGNPDGIIYSEGRDYVVDYAAGTITRCANSRIPDYSTNCLYGRTDFDHAKFPSYRNHEWFVWADYWTTNGKSWAIVVLTAAGHSVVAGVGSALTADAAMSGRASRNVLIIWDLSVGRAYPRWRT